MSKKDHLFEGKMKAFERTIVDYYLATGRAKSITPNMQLVLAYLSIHKHLTQKKLRELTSLSSGTISKHLRALMQYGMIKKESIEGRNENIYKIAELSQLAAKLGDKTTYEFEDIVSFLQQSLKELNKNKGKSGQELLSKRVDELIEAFQTIIKIYSDLISILLPTK